MIKTDGRFRAPAVFFAGLFMALFFAWPYLWAGPPVPDDYSPEDQESYLDEEMLQFGEDYVDLIDELEDVLSEFDDFFEEFGQVSIKEYTKAITKLRRTLKERYSAESYKEMMVNLDDLLEQFETLEMELKESDSGLQRRRLRSLKALEEDLADIREQLDEEVIDARLKYQLDSEKLAEIIEKSFHAAQLAMVEAQKAFKEKKSYIMVPPTPEVPEVPEVPDVPGVQDNVDWFRVRTPNFRNVGDFDGSLTQSGNTSISSQETVIELENAIGGIAVESWNRSEINVELTIGYMEDSKKSSNLAREIKLVIDQDSPVAKVHVQYPDRDKESIGIVSSHLAVSVPRSNPVRIANSFGSVTVEGLDNSLNIKSSFSPVDVQHIKGNVTVANSSGVIYAEDIKGFLDATNSFAPIEAVYIHGGAKLSNSYAPISIEKSSGALTIASSGPVSVDRHSGSADIRTSNGPVEIFGISGNLTVVNSFGEIRVEEVKGDARIENANAVIEVTEIKGSLKVFSNFAPIDITGVGGDITVSSSNGNISIENAKAGVSVTNRFGEVSIGSAVGIVKVSNTNEPVTITDVFSPVTVANQFGPVILSTITGDVVVENSNGSVDLTDIKGAARVKTTFGLISCENLGGPFIIANENGSVEMINVTNISKDCEIKTTFGDIVLGLSRADTYNLIATTSFGQIESDVPMKISSNGNVYSGRHVAGKSNPTIILTGDNSSIKIRTE